jgi:hypothetical protein
VRAPPPSWPGSQRRIRGGCENHPIPAPGGHCPVAQGLDTVLITRGHSASFLLRGGGGVSRLSPPTKTPQARKYSHSFARRVQVSLLPPVLFIRRWKMGHHHPPIPISCSGFLGAPCDSLFRSRHQRCGESKSRSLERALARRDITVPRGIPERWRSLDRNLISRALRGAHGALTSNESDLSSQQRTKLRASSPQP